jgi:hypothetical protein
MARSSRASPVRPSACSISGSVSAISPECGCSTCTYSEFTAALAAEYPPSANSFIPRTSSRSGAAAREKWCFQSQPAESGSVPGDHRYSRTRGNGALARESASMHAMPSRLSEISPTLVTPLARNRSRMPVRSASFTVAGSGVGSGSRLSISFTTPVGSPWQLQRSTTGFPVTEWSGGV